ncbi:TolC family protein [Chloracidobacterium validum]|uniref:TolC family protein n=1 Tax=Chloracidobacterium validum TaxID=2821543 RepID=A0ABX8B679_9BACT|nr:TolC family protein [Chloracidobacterium validum]QUW01937.1 TolC family protein [Chloracidobacterium validum]
MNMHRHSTWAWIALVAVGLAQTAVSAQERSPEAGPPETTPVTQRLVAGIVRPVETDVNQSPAPPEQDLTEQARRQAALEPRVGVTPGLSRPLALRDAILMALRANPEVEIQRIAVQQAAFDVTRTKGFYDITLTNQFSYAALRNPAVNPFAGADENGAVELRTAQNAFAFTKPLMTGGRVGAEVTLARQDTTNIFAGVNPLFTSQVTFTFTQPLFRNLRTDESRRQIELAKKRLTLSDSQFRQRVIDIVAQVQSAYWDLVFARREVEIRAEAVALARIQLEQNRRFVEAGTAAPVDIVSVEAQLEQRQEEFLLSLENLTRVENALKSLMVDQRQSALWQEAIIPTEQVNLEPVNISLEEAVRAALTKRPEMEQFDIQKASNEIDVQFFRDQLRPQLDFVGSYSLQGLAGTPLPITTNPFAGGFNTAVLDRLNLLSANAGLGPLVIPPPVNQTPGVFIGGFGTNLSNLFTKNFYGVRVGVNMSFTLNNRAVQGALGRSLAQNRLIDAQRQRFETQIESEVRNALQSVQTALRRVQSARASRVAAEAQYASEMRRYQVGESTNFLVLDRQNALSGARGREIRALTDYNKAVVALQRAMSTTLDANSLTVKASDGAHPADVQPSVEPNP